jgi:hypothetical protein
VFKTKLKLIDIEWLFDCRFQEFNLTWILIGYAKSTNFSSFFKLRKSFRNFLRLNQSIWPV